ncbi:hypothetical protein ERO13_A06G046101v2 [Gossypium hirsutum]|uniref:Uncharacterized protein isoform X2 n=1 Tax=Gossypium hirsutum TaxID=3635 RepID=A0ABM3BV65_GOSHI|nr:uncharacterized protein LOC107962534 isoform X2 [Gossypium hirsutum]KAG4194302.1 hypothetical protein ERO13_A06G046101v2 [Gossypium hirsutum]
MSGSNLRRRILSLFPIRRGTVTPRDLAQVTRSSSRCTRTRFWRTCWRTFLGFKELVLVCCDGFGISGLAIFVNKCRKYIEPRNCKGTEQCFLYRMNCFDWNCLIINVVEFFYPRVIWM